MKNDDLNKMFSTYFKNYCMIQPTYHSLPQPREPKDLDSYERNFVFF